MSESKKYTIIVKKQRVKVNESVYRAYHQEREVTILHELDFKINDGPWKFDKNWDRVTVPEGVIGYYESIYDIMNVTGYLNNIGHDERNAIDIPIFPPNLELDTFDLQSNSYAFRYRYLYEYEAQDSATEAWEYKVIASPYSETSSQTSKISCCKGHEHNTKFKNSNLSLMLSAITKNLLSTIFTS